LISRQERDAWDVLRARQGQLRLAPSGHVIGIDMDAALKIGATRRHDIMVLSELLPAADAGLVEALSSNRVRDNGLGMARLRTGLHSGEVIDLL
jgi:hypothetical protein